MPKYCGKCGNTLAEGAKFCPKCGTNNQQQSPKIDQKHQAQYVTPQTNVPVSPSSKSKIILLVAIIVVIVAIIIVLAIFFMTGSVNETPISEIVNNGEKYLGKEVTVKGKVPINTDFDDFFPSVMWSVDGTEVLGFMLTDDAQRDVFGYRANGWIDDNGPYYFTGILKTSEFTAHTNDYYIECTNIRKV